MSWDAIETQNLTCVHQTLFQVALQSRLNSSWITSLVNKIHCKCNRTKYQTIVAAFELTNWCQFFMRLYCSWSQISSSHCQSSCGSPSGYADYFDNVMTKFIVNNRTDALKTDINLFFYNNKLANFPLSLADASHEFQIHVSVRILTIKINQWARVKFCSYR